MSRIPLACAVVCVAAAAWVSQGTLASTGTGSSRMALLPLSPGAMVVVALASAAVVAAARRGASLVPLALLAFLALPWLPGPTPPVFQMWTGPLVLLVWLAVALAVGTSLVPRPPAVKRPLVAAGLIACALYGVAAWRMMPSVPGGDEPHYLVITQSLLYDGDLKIEDNHRRGDYRSYFAGSLPPDFRVRGRDGQIYSIHAPGVSALVLPAFAVGGYAGAVVFLILLAAAGSVLAWHLAWLVTG